MLPRELAQERRLTPFARAVLIELLSRPDGWHITARQMWKEARAVLGERTPGYRQYDDAFKELHDAGYLSKQRTQDEQGHWRTDVTVHYPPVQTDNSHAAQSVATIGNTVNPQVSTDNAPGEVSGATCEDEVKAQFVTDNAHAAQLIERQSKKDREETDTLPLRSRGARGARTNSAPDGAPRARSVTQQREADLAALGPDRMRFVLAEMAARENLYLWAIATAGRQLGEELPDDVCAYPYLPDNPLAPLALRTAVLILGADMRRQGVPEYLYELVSGLSWVEEKVIPDYFDRPGYDGGEERSDEGNAHGDLALCVPDFTGGLDGIFSAAARGSAVSYASAMPLMVKWPAGLDGGLQQSAV